MTAKKGIKRLARQRAHATGERYTTALAKVRARGRKRVAVTELRDVTGIAASEDVRCRVVISDALWGAMDAGSSETPLRTLLRRLRALVTSLQGTAAHAALCSAVLTGSGSGSGAPNAVRELFESRRFLEQVDAGVRGASDNGRLIAFDLATPAGIVTVMGALLAAGPTTRPLLWLSTRTAREAASQDVDWGNVFEQLAVAGIGGLADKGDE